jgi:hypothetical protein
MYEEALHIARRTQFFILLSAVVFSVFALSVKPLDKLYSLALLQVETAISIQWDDYLPWVEGKFDQAKTEFDSPVSSQFYFGSDKQASPIEKAFEMMSPFMKTHHKDLQNRELFKQLMGEINFANDMTFKAETMPSHLMDPQTNSPLDITRLTQSPSAQKEATMYYISRVNTEQAVWRSLYNSIVIYDRYNHAIAATEINFYANTGLVESDSKNSENLQSPPWSTLSIFIDGKWIETMSEEGVVLSVKEKYEEQIDIKVKADKKSINQSSISDWLAETYPALGQSSEGQLNPFYGIEHVWREIADRPLSDAALFVQALAAEEKRRNNQVNLFGVNIPAQFVPIVGPLTILLLVFYLSRMITHIQVHTSKHKEVLAEFPWLVLNTKHVWWLDPLFSFMVFPVITQYIIMTKLQNSGIWVQLGWIFTSLTLLIGVRVWGQLHRLRLSISGFT